MLCDVYQLNSRSATVQPYYNGQPSTPRVVAVKGPVCGSRGEHVHLPVWWRESPQGSLVWAEPRKACPRAIGQPRPAGPASAGGHHPPAPPPLLKKLSVVPPTHPYLCDANLLAAAAWAWPLTPTPQSTHLSPGPWLGSNAKVAAAAAAVTLFTVTQNLRFNLSTSVRARTSIRQYENLFS